MNSYEKINEVYHRVLTEKTLKNVTFSAVEGPDDQVEKNMNKAVPKNIKVKIKWTGMDPNDAPKADVTGSPAELKKFQKWYDEN